MSKYSTGCLKKCLFKANGTFHFRKQINGKRYKVWLRTASLDEALEKADLLYTKISEDTKYDDLEIEYNEDITISQLVRVLVDCKHHCRESTRTYYEYCARMLYDFFSRDEKIKTVTLQKVNRYVTFMKNKKFQKRTIKHQIGFLKQLTRYALKLNIIRRNPLELLQLPKIEKQLPRRLEDHEIILFLRELDSFNRLPAKLSLACGLRKGEILKLTWDDIDFTNRQLLVRADTAKGVKDRLVPLCAEIIYELTEAKARALPEVKWVCPDKTGKQQRVDIREGIKNAFSKIGRMDLTFHSLRKTFATRYLEQNPEDLYGLMRICGWEDLSTARIYIADTHKARMDRVEKVSNIIPRDDEDVLPVAAAKKIIQLIS